MRDFLFRAAHEIYFNEVVVNKNWNVAAQEYKRYDSAGNELKKRNADFLENLYSPI